MKQDISDLKTKCANIEVVKEEIEMKNESLSEIIKCLEDKLDDAYGESRMLEDTLKNLQRKAADMNENLDMKENKIIDLEEELLKLQISYDILGAAQKESEENTMMLENVVESKIIEISDLKKSLKIIKKDTNDEDDCQPSTSKCGKCEYESDGENDLLMHIKSNHDITCDVCALTFQSETKLKIHMCRMHVKNPTCGDHYTRSSIVVDCCTVIFSKSKEQEVVYLHSEQCFNDTNRCSDFYPSYHINDFDGEAYHAPLKYFFLEGKINWNALNGELVKIRF